MVMTGRGDREVALDLMRLALPLLDRAGASLAAARLQSAIDCAGSGVVKSERAMSTIENERTWSTVAPLPQPRTG